MNTVAIICAPSCQAAWSSQGPLNFVSSVLSYIIGSCASQHGSYYCDESNPGWTLWPGRRFSSWTWSPGSSAGWRRRRSRLSGVLASSLLSSSSLSIACMHALWRNISSWHNQQTGNNCEPLSEKIKTALPCLSQTRIGNHLLYPWRPRWGRWLWNSTGIMLPSPAGGQNPLWKFDV